MQNTLDIFNDRKQEVDFYFSVMAAIDKDTTCLNTSDNTRFYKIMKSNFLLMLYNLVEACIISGMMEIYEDVKNNNCSYNQVIQEIQDIWTKHEINEIYGPTTQRIVYENRIQKIIQTITTSTPLMLSRKALDIDGNLDAKKIRTICDKHKIRYTLTTKGTSLRLVKDERNSLSHGDVSFSNCARDLTINDLEAIKNEVITFLTNILDGMKFYYDNKQYKI